MFEGKVVQTDPITVAYLPMTGPYSQIAEGYGKLYGWVAQAGLVPMGMPQSVYITSPREVPEDQAEWELWAPVGADVEPVVHHPVFAVDVANVGLIEFGIARIDTWRSPGQMVVTGLGIGEQRVGVDVALAREASLDVAVCDLGFVTQFGCADLVVPSAGIAPDYIV